MRDVRINKDVPVGPTCKMKRSDEIYILNFRNKKIPPIIITFVQVCKEKERQGKKTERTFRVVVFSVF